MVASRVYLRQGARDKAMEFAKAAVRIAENTARDPKQSADVGEALLVLANAQDSAGDRAGARASAQRSVEALSTALGENHSLTRAARRLQRSFAA